MQDFDYLSEARAIRDGLVTKEMANWKERIDSAISSGSTGTEILMGLRRTMVDMLKGKQTISPEIHAKAITFISAANKLLS